MTRSVKICMVLLTKASIWSLWAQMKYKTMWGRTWLPQKLPKILDDAILQFKKTKIAWNTLINGIQHTGRLMNKFLSCYFLQRKALNHGFLLYTVSRNFLWAEIHFLYEGVRNLVTYCSMFGFLPFPASVFSVSLPWDCVFQKVINT